MKISIAAGIVLYNPNIKRLALNIDSIISQVETIYLFDNGSKNRQEIDNLLKKYHSMNVVYIDGKDNMGISYALNVLIQKADSDGYKWLLTLDQDSVSPKDMILSMCRYIYKEDVGIICPIYYDSRRKNTNYIVPEDKYREVKFCITSGALTNIDICKKIGGFDNYLFIGLVDNEYCYRLLMNGYKIIQDCSIVLDHELGNIRPSKLEKFYLKVSHVTGFECIKKLSYKREVSPFRVYYATRNMIYLNHIYKKNEVSDWSQKTIIKNCISSLLRGKNKIKIFNSIVRGIKDGKDKCSKW